MKKNSIKYANNAINAKKYYITNLFTKIYKYNIMLIENDQQ